MMSGKTDPLDPFYGHANAAADGQTEEHFDAALDNWIPAPQSENPPFTTRAQGGNVSQGSSSCAGSIATASVASLGDRTNILSCANDQSRKKKISRAKVESNLTQLRQELADALATLQAQAQDKETWLQERQDLIQDNQAWEADFSELKERYEDLQERCVCEALESAAAAVMPAVADSPLESLRSSKSASGYSRVYRLRDGWKALDQDKLHIGTFPGTPEGEVGLETGRRAAAFAVLKAQEAAADRDLEKIRCGQDRYSLLKNFAKKQSAAVSQAGLDFFDDF